MAENGAVALKPSNLAFEEAAALSFGGTTALDFLRRGKLKRGESVLVNGASGAVGIAAVQIANHFGAFVTGVCSSANMELVKSLGASHVIDYTQEDFTQNGETYDVIVDAVGTAPFSRSKASLKEPSYGVGWAARYASSFMDVDDWQQKSCRWASHGAD